MLPERQREDTLVGHSEEIAPAQNKLLGRVAGSDWSLATALDTSCVSQVNVYFS